MQKQAQGQKSADRNSFSVWADSQAESWEEAYPLGNGTLGAMVYGKTDCETVELNHDTLWTGYPRPEQWRGDGKASLDRARALIQDRKYAEADAELSCHFGSYASEAYLPMGRLVLHYTDCAEKARHYRRSLNLRDATLSVSYSLGERSFERSVWISAPDRVYMDRTVCKGGTFSATLTLQSPLASRTYVEQSDYLSGGRLHRGRIYLEGECCIVSEQNLERTDRSVMYSDDPAQRGIQFLCGAGVLTDGVLRHRGDYIEVEHASCLDIRLNAETSFDGYRRHPYLSGKAYREPCRERLEYLLEQDYDALLDRHIRDYGEYFGRSRIRLGNTLQRDIPTARRIERYAKGEEDPALPALIYHFGRYLTISASRAGSQAMNLQGIWNPHVFAPWHSNYTVNINTQMNYFPTLAFHLPEMYEPLLRLISELADTGRTTARHFYGADGWVCHHNTDLWRHTQPVPGKAQYLFWNAAGAWLCRHLYEYYEYTLDTEFLRQTAYPVMRESVRFYLSQLEDSEDGWRIVTPSTSPENRYLCENGSSSVSETTEMTMAAVRGLFANYLGACQILGITDDITRAVQKEQPRLRPSMIGENGGILEWYGEHREADPHHRAVSSLYGLYPGTEISPLRTPELAAASRNTLSRRGDDGPGWGIAWKCCMYARLLDGEHANALLKRMIRPCRIKRIVSNLAGGIYSNLFCAHPPFQIDGNFGIAAGIAEMLLQSDTETVHLMPAIPAEWRDIEVTGMLAKGGRTVSYRTEQGKLTFCRIDGNCPQRILVAGADCTANFVDREGAVEFTASSKASRIVE